MVPRTRRHLLQVATAVAGGLAGCGQLTGDASHSSQSSSESNGSNVPASNTETDPPILLHRAESEMPPIRLRDSDQKETPSSQPGQRSPRVENVLIDSQSKGQQLTVTDSIDNETVSSFVSATDFDSETLYLETRQVKECFRLQFCYVSWQPSKIQTDYVQKLRPYDDHCAVDGQVFESRLIRLPVALDEESVNSFGTTISGSGQCNATGAARARGSSGRTDSTETPSPASDGGGQ